MTTNFNEFQEVSFTHIQLKVINEVLIHKQSQASVAKKYGFSTSRVQNILRKWEERVEDQPLILSVEEVSEKAVAEEEVEVMSLPLPYGLQCKLRRADIHILRDLMGVYEGDINNLKQIKGIGSLGYQQIHDLLTQIYKKEEVL